MSHRVTRKKSIRREADYKYTADEETEDDSSSNSSSNEYNDDETTSESSMESQSFDERDDEFLSSSSTEEEEEERSRPVKRKLTYSDCEDDEIEVLEPPVKKVKLTQPDIVEFLNVIS